ncbi:type II toxin-antitoxin system RelE/ParE family toxin [Methylopila henanensis]|uniref:Type II toxin-antitoxin system RelE/ParE family toxin n=1 Tax=Methylopila henanensis TaxID=873516 RepID=A0ABW4K384_9HYPH
MTADAVRFARRAIADLDDIYDFHHARTPRYAEQLNLRLRVAALSIARHPERGAALPRTPHFRRLVESDHLIVYAAQDGRIFIVRILYGARDVDALLSAESPWPA